MKTTLALAVIVAVGSSVSADDLRVPEWRGAPGSTFQEWRFDELNDQGTPQVFWPEVADNAYGDPYLWCSFEDPGFMWSDELFNRQGTISPDWEWLEITLPHVADPPPLQDAYIQFTWHTSSYRPIPYDYLSPDPGPFEIVEEFALDDGWMYTRWFMTFDTTDDGWEEFQVWSEGSIVEWDMIIDQIVVDTRYVPAPGSPVVFAVAGLVGCRRRRR
ncbi:MAG: hypothetical protein KAS72_02850 [Phycisphaerales bacterium]|nr:hypothetical protein [Phycisphaerales bacterium]